MIDWFLRMLDVWEEQWKEDGDVEMLDEARDIRRQFELLPRAALYSAFVLVMSLVVAVLVVAAAIGWELGS